MTTDADDTKLVTQTKTATVGHTAWQVAVAGGTVAVLQAFNVELTEAQALAVMGAVVPVLTALKTIAVATMGSRSAMAQQLQDLQEQLEQLQ